MKVRLEGHAYILHTSGKMVCCLSCSTIEPNSCANSTAAVST